MSIPKKAAIIAAQLATIGIILFLWQGASRKQASFLSRPTAVWKALTKWFTNDTLLSYIPITLTEAGLGLLVGVAAAVVGACVMASSKRLAEIFEPFVAVANAAPRVALAPLFLLIFGIGLSSKVWFIASAVVFIPFFSIFRALTSIEPEYLQSTRCLGASRRWTVIDVYIPAVLSSVLSSLRVAVTFALLTAVLAEFLASQGGIGYQIQQAQTNLQPDFAIAGIVILGVISFVIDRAIVMLERHLLAWRGAS